MTRALTVGMLFVVYGSLAPLWAQTPAGELAINQVRGNIYVLSGAGANITVSAGDDGLLFVDAGLGTMSERVVAALARMPRFLTPSGSPAPGTPPIRRLRYILNTNAFPDYVGGNPNLAAAAGAPAIYAHENVLARVVADKMPTRGEPTLTFFGARMVLSRWFNDEGVELLHMPNAVTDGDSVVFFRRSEVLSTGAIFDYTQFPRIDVARGGSVEGLLAALNRMLQIVFPSGGDGRTESGTMVVPGHGRICDVAELANYRNMVTIIRDRIADGIKKKMTLQQVQAARPTEEYDGQFGNNPAWTPDMFVEAIYTSLTSGVRGSN